MTYKERVIEALKELEPTAREEVSALICKLRDLDLPETKKSYKTFFKTAKTLVENKPDIFTGPHAKFEAVCLHSARELAWLDIPKIMNLIDHPKGDLQKFKTFLIACMIEIENQPPISPKFKK